MRDICLLNRNKYQPTIIKKKRENKVLRKVIEKDTTSMGLFFRFKIYIIIKNVGQIIAIKITKSILNIMITVVELSKKLKCSIYNDKISIIVNIFYILYERDRKIITESRKNIKNLIY